jgi:hypothetical protein
MGRVTLRNGLLALLLAPATAWSQDLTSLVLPMGPPLVLAPLLAMKLRTDWLLPKNGTEASPRALMVLGGLEMVLWIVIVGAIVMLYFDERWLVAPAVPVALGVLVAAARRVGAPHRSWRFTLAMLSVFLPCWLVIQMASFVLFMSLG